MTLREALGHDVRRIYAQVAALLDREDGVLALFDGNRVVTYANGFEVSASQLELLGVELERAFRSAAGRGPAAGAGRRRRHEVDQGDRIGNRVDRSGDGAAGRVLRLARKIA
jgi:hypothetical protein